MKMEVLFLGLAAGVADVIGGLIVAGRRRWPEGVQAALLALGAGFILALAFIELIPDSLVLLPSSAPIYLLLGYATLHFFEHTVVRHLHFGEETHAEVMVSHSASVSAFAGLLVHAFFDGVAISVGMQYSFLLGLLVFSAIFLHKFPEGLTIGSIMHSAGYSPRLVVVSAIAVGAATVVGVSSVFVLERVGAGLVGAAFAFSAGTIVYVGASDLIPEINKTRNRLPPILVFGGILLFYLSKSLLERFVR